MESKASLSVMDRISQQIPDDLEDGVLNSNAKD